MDILAQTKLTKSEWDSLEVPVPPSEKVVLELIRDGYENPKCVTNPTQNMMQFSKLPSNEGMHYYVYSKYFQETVSVMTKKYGFEWSTDSRALKKLKSADMIRIQNVDQNIQNHKHKIYEFMCMELCLNIVKKMHRKKMTYAQELYTLMEWRKAILQDTNPIVLSIVDKVLLVGKKSLSVCDVLASATDLIEKNADLYKCENVALYPHQKEMFSFCKLNANRPKLILYTAPTGTGKTLTPIGLSQGYRIIFVCVARHIGLALAKSAISIGKRVAFAFGCTTADDIRLHYYSAIDYERNKRSGGIGKVDNSNGSAVEIMICDVQSYLVAMYYMQSFHPLDQLLMYWDEPTMTLDYETHGLHSTIHHLWSNNKIPNVVLSCATLPNLDEIQDCIHDFRSTFIGAEVHQITSYDCRKSIPIINVDGYSFMPHIHCETFEQLTSYVAYCQLHKTLLRYFDLQEIVAFVTCMHESYIPNQTDPLHMDTYFEELSDFTMHNIKLYYLNLLARMTEPQWTEIKRIRKIAQKKKFIQENCQGQPLSRMTSMPALTSTLSNNATTEENGAITRANSDGQLQDRERIRAALSGVLLTTKDAYTLTDGPTIYLADNLMNLARFYIQQSKIPDVIMQELMNQIHANDELQKRIEEHEKRLEQKLQVKNNTDTGAAAATCSGGDKKKDNTAMREKAGLDENTQVLKDNIDQMKKMKYHLSLKSEYIPNRREHMNKWLAPENARGFTQDVDEQTVKEIMELEIDSSYKILVLMGIGVLIKQDNKKYEEIVKRLAQEQQLYLILASSDFIYGTNYQFCHGFIGKDLPNMTPQKILQSMGRIGRNSTQQDYSVRFRNDAMIHQLFQTPNINREAINMNTLLCHEEEE